MNAPNSLTEVTLSIALAHDDIHLSPNGFLGVAQTSPNKNVSAVLLVAKEADSRIACVRLTLTTASIGVIGCCISRIRYRSTCGAKKHHRSTWPPNLSSPSHIGAELSFVSAYTNQQGTDTRSVRRPRCKVNSVQAVWVRPMPQPGAFQADDGGASLVLPLLPVVILQRKV